MKLTKQAIAIVFVIIIAACAAACMRSATEPNSETVLTGSTSAPLSTHRSQSTSVKVTQYSSTTLHSTFESDISVSESKDPSSEASSEATTQPSEIILSPRRGKDVLQEELEKGTTTARVTKPGEIALSPNPGKDVLEAERSGETTTKATTTTRPTTTKQTTTKPTITRPDDPYDVYDYWDPEDFYYDHYDDFFDYYDAEDYFYDHQ